MGKYDEFMKKTSDLQHKFLYQNRRSFNTSIDKYKRGEIYM